MSEKKKKVYEVVPDGEYLVRAKELTVKKTKNGKGTMVSGLFQHVKDPDNKSGIFHHFMIEHPTEAAVEIGKKKLDYYLKAVGLEDGLDGIDYDYTRLDEYVGIPFVATLAKETTDNFGDQNRIVKFSAR